MKKYIETRDHSVSKENFDLLYDEGLDLLRTSPRPADLSSYYEDEAYISHTDASTTLIEKIYQLVRSFNLKKKERWIEEYLKEGGRILDLGAGTGALVNYLRSRGWDVDGVEPNKRARIEAKKKGITLFENIEEVQTEKYDLITLWHVLEHFVDLEAEIDGLLKLIHKDGTLIIAVPNYKSYDAAHYGTFWAGYDVPRHLWHFSQTAIKKIFGRKGWEVIATKPMTFDSFYISLLSEKYQYGKSRFWSAFWHGLRSNWNGKRTGEYSSLAYVLKIEKTHFNEDTGEF
jgi:2-polyprenyl-3-methyl-5-hydroxy-6-metoxy-1,4-benzoquinol methylase